MIETSANLGADPHEHGAEGGLTIGRGAFAARFEEHFERRVDGASLAVVRLVFGTVGALSAWRLLSYGWVDALYASPAHHFTYPGLHWVRPPPQPGMTALVVVMGVAAVGVAVGWHYRWAMGIFLFSFGWIEAIDVATYLNHYWFLTTFGIVLWFFPPAATVRAGTIWFLRFLIAVVYGFAGLAKLNTTWLVDGAPLRFWLPARADLPFLGTFLAQPNAATAMSWGGAIFDCSIVTLLLLRRTRPVAWLLVVTFHLATWVLFPIGVFPFLMIGATTVFFDPNWPRQLAARLRRASPPTDRVATSLAPPKPMGRAGRVAIAMVCLLSVVVPLRHLLYPGDAAWTNEGYRFSWNVLLNEKAGSVAFHVTDSATGLTHVTSGERLFTPLQYRVMSTDPELIRQAAHLIASEASRTGRRPVVRVDAWVSLNGGPAAPLIDPTVDLAAEPGRLTPQPWILPAPTVR